MFKNCAHIRSTLLGAAMLVAPLVITGCSAHVSAGYRVYDPYHTDYHVWGPGEEVYYNRYAAERRLEHREFRKLKREEKKDYWDWRHNQK